MVEADHLPSFSLGGNQTNQQQQQQQGQRRTTVGRRAQHRVTPQMVCWSLKRKKTNTYQH
jgi:hypothetical protein